MTSGSASVKKPAPPSPLFTGGSWPGSPSTSTLVPKERRSRPSFSSTIEHSSTTTSLAFAHLARAVQREGRLQLARLLLRLLAARAVDQRMDGAGIGAAAVAHDLRRLAGEGGEEHLAVGVVGDPFRQHRLAGAGDSRRGERPAGAAISASARRRGARRPAGGESCISAPRQRSSEVGLGKIVALVEQRHAMLLRHGVGEAVAEIQARRMAAAFAETARGRRWQARRSPHRS